MCYDSDSFRLWSSGYDTEVCQVAICVSEKHSANLKMNVSCLPQNTGNDIPDYMCYNPVNHNVNLNCHENFSWMLCRGSQLWSSASCSCTFMCVDLNFWYECVIFFQLVVSAQTIKYEYYHFWKCLPQT